MDSIESHNTNSTLIKDIHYFLQNGDKEIKYSPNKDIVLMLGNTGSGKSTLTQYVSGNDDKLFSVDIDEGTGEYVIVDKQNKISKNSTIISHTIYPELIEDAKTNKLYYDCPGFSDTRSAAHEIAATYFIKKVIDSARSVKLVFTVTHNSVSTGQGRTDFILMLQHALEFIKEMEKFNNSIALIVTKIENRYVGSKMVSDEKVIAAIGKFLEQAKRDIDKHPEVIISPGEGSKTKEKVFSLLDIFLSKDKNGQYTRIGIFRKPDAPGPISGNELMKEGKISLENLINKNIQYVKVAENDFGYTISSKSIVYISGLADEINKTIVKELANIGKEVEEYCIAQEGEETLDLDDLISRYQKIQESFKKVQSNAIKDAISPKMFINEIFDNTKYFNISISDLYKKTIQKEGDYINFLNLVSNQSIKNHKSSILVAGISELINYLDHSQSFYRMLNNMYGRLSEFYIQKNRHIYNTIQVNELDDIIKSPIYKEIQSIFKEIVDIKDMKLDKSKLTLLNRVLDETLKHQTEVTRTEIDTIVVKGVNIKLSEISEKLSNTDIKFIEVYALHKVFIDTSLDMTGREIQMAFVAPVWEVVGSQSIILDGKPGMDHYPQKARSGNKDGESGFDGLTGGPGGPAGNFIGIGQHFINEANLRISANGGKGGRGQDGGDGAEGYDGAHCPTCKPQGKSLFTVFYNTADAEFSGQVGGNGGNGGIGGYGGLKGFIHIIKVGAQSGIFQGKQIALDGHPGENGKGGKGGEGGRYFQYKIRNYVLLVHQEYFEPIDKWASSGQLGKDGTALFGRENTWKLKRLININDIRTESKNYLQNNIKNNLKSTSLKTFLSEMDNNLRFLTQQIINRKRRNIQKPEKQLKSIDKYSHGLTEIHSQSHDQYVGGAKHNYYLDLYQHLNNNTAINKPVLSNFLLETKNIKQIPTKPFIPIQHLENMKTEKHINLNDQYPTLNLHGNLLLTDIVLKKLIGKATLSNQYDIESSKDEKNSAQDLAYKYYL